MSFGEGIADDDQDEGPARYRVLLDVTHDPLPVLDRRKLQGQDRQRHARPDWRVSLTQIQFADIDEAVKAMVAIDHTIDPDGQTTNVYQDLFQVFRHAYEAQAQSGVYQEICQFQQRYF